MSTLRNVNIKNGVPEDYKYKMEINKVDKLQIGTLNKLKLRPKILNEHQESSRETLGVVTSATTVGQIFKASKDNINSIFLTLESSEALFEIDNIEEVDNATLQTNWALVGVNLAILNTSIKSSRLSSTKSMEVMMDNLDSWTYTLSAATNMSGGTIEFDYQQTKETAKATMTLTIGDGVGTSVVTLNIQKAERGVWKHLTLPTSSFVGTADVSLITTIMFSVTQTNGGEFAYIDNVNYRNVPGEISVELWDFGVNMPPTGGTMDYTTGGTQYTTLGDLGIGGISSSAVTLDLKGGKNLYNIENFVAGVAKEIPSNNLLTENNYYGLVIKYIDTDVSVYGANTNFEISYYNNGFAWTAPSTTNIISVSTGQTGGGAYSDIMFGINSVQDVYINSMEVKLFDSSHVLTQSAVDSEAVFSIEDAGMKMEIIALETFINKEHKKDISINPMFMESGGKAEIYYYSSSDDSISHSIFELEYFYKKPTTNG